MKKFFTLITASTIAIASSAQEQAPAFPGAEGHGRYTTGGRGGKIVHVTNLNDSGTGSLRAAVSGSSKKIVVFDVSGTIELKSDLIIGANTTIAGQTAPGAGITIRYYTARPNGDNIIIRFIRVRRGEERDVDDGADAIWTRNRTGMILDHCSFSWSIDEIASFYDNNNFTMQWCSISECLNNAGHGKGAHGYGGIWGGKLASFHHNLIAHISNRGPRFNGARYIWEGYKSNKLYSTYNWANTVQAENVDYRNCVLYDGDGSCYGGPGGGQINMVNNYIKGGPQKKSTYNRITTVSIGASGNSTKEPLVGMTSRYYIDGNTVESNAGQKTKNRDWAGVTYDSGITTQNGVRYTLDNDNYYGDDVEHVTIGGKSYVTVKMDKPTYTGTVTTHSAEAAYEKVLAHVGASLHRDAEDTRYSEETRTGTAKYKGSVTGKFGQIDKVGDVGGYTPIPSESRPAGYDTDGDGIPDEWEKANGLNPNDAADANLYTLDTEKQWYTNIEVYLNSIVEHIIKEQNADAIDTVNEYFPSFTAGISDIEAGSSSEIVAIEYFSLDGRAITEPANGITIRRIIYADGHVEADKVIK